MYQLMPQIKLLDGTIKPSQTVFKIDENMWIPFDPANTDYQAYLKWVAEGNTPLPAENE